MSGPGSTHKWVALLRGMNVGGANKVPMAALRGLAGGLGWADVRSYIASGNLVFSAAGEAEALAAALRGAMAEAMGVDVPVLVLPGAALVAARVECPFEPEEGRHVHGFFLWEAASVDAGLLAELKAGSEVLEVRGRVVWLSAPDGIARSKLAARMSTVLGGAAYTARNLNTVDRLVAMLGQASRA